MLLVRHKSESDETHVIVPSASEHKSVNRTYLSFDLVHFKQTFLNTS